MIRFSQLALRLLACVSIVFPGAELLAQSSRPVAGVAADAVTEVQLSFDRAPWKEVVQSLAEAGGLALHVGDLPPGSFTYSDPRTFALPEAISRVNLFLLPEGYTLVRSGKLLSVINLSDPRSLRQLDAIATLVDIEDLDGLESHQVVKCLFALGEMDAEAAVDELSSLNLMTTPAVFARTNRLMITDTAEKLRVVQSIMAAFQPDALNNGTIVRNFELQHVDAEDILVVARPHMGLATGEMIGIDVSISADPQGRNIFVTGVEDKVKLIEGLIKSLDKKQDVLSPDGPDMQLRAHPVMGSDVETVYNVLLTLLADQTVRMSVDEDSGSIIALASPTVQTRIENTIAELQGAEAEFAVIPLKTIDPYFAVSLLEEMLDLSESEPTSFRFDDFWRGGFRRGEDQKDDAPRIDADPDGMRLFVRARKHQLDQIRKIVQELDESSSNSLDSSGSGETIRILKFGGPQAEELLRTAGRFWRGQNPIILFPSPPTVNRKGTERVVAADPRTSDFDELFSRSPAVLNRADTEHVQLLSNNLRSDAPPIRCQVTGRGLLLQSEDTAALDQFERHLRTISGPVDSLPSPPVVFYLKYARPDDALRTLAELLDGGEAARESESGSLVNGVTSSGSSYLGSIVSTRAGTITMMAGTITVVADMRLNRLIAQGTARDIELIESYLRIVDKDNSITDVETHGRARVIELQHTRASEVAAVLRDAFGSRLTKGSSGNSSGQKKPGSAPQQRPREENRDGNNDRPRPSEENKKPAAQKSGSGQVARTTEPQMTIAVHEPSNSLIVTAPEQLFREVEELAKAVDTRSAQTVRIIRTDTGGPSAALIQQIFGDRIRMGGSSGTAAPSRSVPDTRRTTTSTMPRSERRSDASPTRSATPKRSLP